ncbi:MAG: hypothetical protein INR70_08760 [Parafilimonas terrae]|nr:hypothetical protein [Parafilimonas terrae]
MPGLRHYKARDCAALAIVFGLILPSCAHATGRHRLRAVRDVQATASVTLDRLSVGALGVDKPWNPRICVGCDQNNAVGAVRRNPGRFR